MNTSVITREASRERGKLKINYCTLGLLPVHVPHRVRYADTDGVAAPSGEALAVMLVDGAIGSGAGESVIGSVS